MGETSITAEYVADHSLSDIPTPAIERSKTLIRDLIGVALYGSQQPIADTVLPYVDVANPGSGATILGSHTASPAGAALANGIFAHTADFDDTFEAIVLHPSAPVLPAVLAAAEHVDATGADLITGYSVGVDVSLALGEATFPAHYDNGWHATGTIGSFGAAAGACSVLGLAPTEVRNALGIVGSCSSSLLKNAGTMTKSFHAGHAASAGLRAAMLAERGFTADQDILDGPRGYGSVMTPDGAYNPSLISTVLEEECGVLDVGIKPYACGRILHSGLEALRELLVREDLSADDVSSVRVTLDEAAEKIITYTEPEDVFEAKASIEFPHAAILRRHRAGVEEFTESFILSDETRAQMRKIERQFEPNLFDGGYGGYGGRVEVETTAGRTLVAEEREAIGTLEKPLPEARLLEKFATCSGAVLSGAERERLTAAIDNLADASDVDGLVSALTPTARTA